MRKKSPATIQKWVDSIAVDDSETSKEHEIIEEKTSNCDISEASTSGENLKVKLNEICSKLTAKGKKIELKNLLKLKRENSMEQTNDSEPEIEKIERLEVKCEENSEEKLKISNHEPLINLENSHQNDSENEENEENSPPNDKTNNLAVQRCPLGVLGRSCSENPPRNRRLNDIGRSFSVSHENELEANSSENLIYDADEDISITIPSLNTSSSVVSNNTNQSLSNSQLLPGRSMRPAREHTVSEGHQSPQIQPRNPLLRDSSFQSDSSHCSSVESLLEARKPDAEAILISLGFGPARGTDDIVSKIPKRFLKPSQVKGNDTDAFLRNQHLSMHIHENSVLGYRGLLGNSNVPSTVVKAIIDRFSANHLQRMESEDYYKPKTFKGLAHTVLAHRQFMKN